MSLGDLQACPWCAFVGTPRLFDLHMEIHEAKDTELRQGITAHQYQLAQLEISALKEKLEIAEAEVNLAQAESRILKVQLKERQKDYAKTLSEQVAKNAALAAALAVTNWILEGLRK